MAEFKDTVKAIEDSEKNVDEVLKAARLSRIENGRMSNERLEMILTAVGIYIGIILAFALMFCFMYFTRK